MRKRVPFGTLVAYVLCVSLAARGDVVGAQSQPQMGPPTYAFEPTIHSAPGTDRQEKEKGGPMKGPRKVRRAPLLIALASLALVVSGSIAQADSIPTGQRTFGQSRLEPAYNAAQAGQIGYLLTPDNAPVTQQPAAWAPLYIVLYPVGTTAATTLNCMHTPIENCPTHGDGAAAFAQATEPSVYGDGVLGHDHVLDFPSGDDFNIAWEPVRVLFTSKAAANEHLITDDAILAAKARGDVRLFPAPARTFNCAVVPEAVWNLGTPMV